MNLTHQIHMRNEQNAYVIYVELDGNNSIIEQLHMLKCTNHNMLAILHLKCVNYPNIYDHVHPKNSLKIKECANVKLNDHE